MTGCDHIGVFKGLTKSRCFNVYLEIESVTNGTVLDAGYVSFKELTIVFIYSENLIFDF